jgi:hypothetical protein
MLFIYGVNNKIDVSDCNGSIWIGMDEYESIWIGMDGRVFDVFLRV